MRGGPVHRGLELLLRLGAHVAGGVVVVLDRERVARQVPRADEVARAAGGDRHRDHFFFGFGLHLQKRAVVRPALEALIDEVADVLGRRGHVVAAGERDADALVVEALVFIRTEHITIEKEARRGGAEHEHQEERKHR